MGHTVSDAADRAVKHSEQRGKTISERTPEERLAMIRNNLRSGIFNPPVEQKFLLFLYDQALETIATLQEISHYLKDQNEQLRSVYEQENRCTVVKVERVLGQGDEEITHPHEVARFHDDGGPAGDHSTGD